MYKSVFTLYKLFPEAYDFDNMSIFDKAYYLQLITHATGNLKKRDLKFIQNL
jgi:hypothetical protein